MKDKVWIINAAKPNMKGEELLTNIKGAFGSGKTIRIPSESRYLEMGKI